MNNARSSAGGLEVVRVTQQEPPIRSVEAEQAVLGALLLHPDEAMPKVESIGVVVDNFTEGQNGLIFGAIMTLWRRGQAFDTLSVFDHLQAGGNEARGVTLAYLTQLSVAVPGPANAGVHAAIVVEKARRRWIEGATKAIQRAARGPQSLEELLGQVDAFTDGLQRFSRPPLKPAIPLEWVADPPAELQAPAQIVEGVLTAGGMSMMFGESNSGKSYLAIRLAICVSLGEPWLGRRTTGGPVLYVAAEGAWSIRLRLAADARHHGRAVGRFGLIPCALSLVDPSADVESLIELIHEQRAKIGEPIRLVVVDTVARVMGGGDENTAQDMGRLVAAGDRIREATGAHLLYVHHAGKDASRGARGHSSLRAALDTEIEVTADEANKTHTAQVTKQRDLASKGDRITGRFVSVELGVDQWGGPITACAVVDAEADSPGGQARRMSSTMRVVLGYLAGQAAGVRKAAVVAALEPQGIHRASTYRALNELLAAGLVTETLGLVYVPKE